MNHFKDAQLAESTWEASPEELEALESHCYVKSLARVDQIWPWLNNHYGEVLAVDSPHTDPPEKYTYSQLSALIKQAARSFQSLGVGKGDVVALFSENSPRWLIADQALMSLDASNAVRGSSAPVEELRYILEDSDAVGLIVQNSDLFFRLDLTENQLKKLKFVINLEGISVKGTLEWNEFLAEIGTESLPPLNSDRDISSSTSTVATILYTSGTTGEPKGVPLTHANLLHQIKSLRCIANPEPGASVLSVLPIWHSYERSAEYYFFSCGCTQTYTTIKNFKKDLPRIRPFVMATVPRLWEAIQSGFDDAVYNMPRHRQLIIRGALANSSAYKVAYRVVRSLSIQRISKKARGMALIELALRWPLHAVSNTLLWPKVRKQLCGGSLNFPISGGGAIAPHVDLFFEALGIELLVGYGLTETSPVLTCRRPWRNIRMSAGAPLPETKIKIVNPRTGVCEKFRECGQVMVKGPQVMSGYWKKTEETSKVLNDQGWFNTGDLGMLLPSGELVLTGRSKDTIVLTNGENIEPGPLEEFLVSSPLIEQVMLIGQDEKQLGALLVPNVDAMGKWLESSGLSLVDEDGVYSVDLSLTNLLRREINRLLSMRLGSRSEEKVGGVALVQPFTIENGLLTQTLKQKRNSIRKRDAKLIGLIYGK